MTLQRGSSTDCGIHYTLFSIDSFFTALTVILCVRGEKKYSAISNIRDNNQVSLSAKSFFSHSPFTSTVQHRVNDRSNREVVEVGVGANIRLGVPECNAAIRGSWYSARRELRDDSISMNVLRGVVRMKRWESWTNLRTNAPPHRSL